MKEAIDTVILSGVYGIAVLAIIAGLLYVIMWLIGQIIKLLGYWQMFYKVMMRMARDGEFKRGK